MKLFDCVQDDLQEEGDNFGRRQRPSHTISCTRTLYTDYTAARVWHGGYGTGLFGDLWTSGRGRSSVWAEVTFGVAAWRKRWLHEAGPAEIRFFSKQLGSRQGHCAIRAIGTLVSCCCLGCESPGLLHLRRLQRDPLRRPLEISGDHYLDLLHTPRQILQ